MSEAGSYNVVPEGSLESFLNEGLGVHPEQPERPAGSAIPRWIIGALGAGILLLGLMAAFPEIFPIRIQVLVAFYLGFAWFAVGLIIRVINRAVDVTITAAARMWCLISMVSGALFVLGSIFFTLRLTS